MPYGTLNPVIELPNVICPVVSSTVYQVTVPAAPVTHNNVPSELIASWSGPVPLPLLTAGGDSGVSAPLVELIEYS